MHLSQIEIREAGAEDFLLEWRSAGLDTERTRTVVVVPTYRRPAQLAATLASLAAQTGVGGFAVLVVENESVERHGFYAAIAAFEKHGMPGAIVIARQTGNVHAINAGFGAALAAFPALDHALMIDDDEVATPHWLAAMVSCAEREDADVVGGPVKPRFERVVPPGVERHPVFRPAFARSGPVAMIYGSGNCLIRRRTFERLGLPAFDTRFDRLGGGDTDFFTRARRAGCRFHWVEEALIHETVPAARTRRGWILRRGLRIGAINRQLDKSAADGILGRLKVVAKDGAILLVATGKAVSGLLRAGEPLIALHPLVIAVGRVASAFGLEPHQYGRKQP